MIVRTQDALQALTAFDADAKKQEEADRSRSLSLVRAEKEEHDRHAPSACAAGAADCWEPGERG